VRHQYLKYAYGEPFVSLRSLHTLLVTLAELWSSVGPTRDTALFRDFLSAAERTPKVFAIVSSPGYGGWASGDHSPIDEGQRGILATDVAAYRFPATREPKGRRIGRVTSRYWSNEGSGRSTSWIPNSFTGVDIVWLEMDGFMIAIRSASLVAHEALR